MHRTHCLLQARLSHSTICQASRYNHAGIWRIVPGAERSTVYQGWGQDGHWTYSKRSVKEEKPTLTPNGGKWWGLDSARWTWPSRRRPLYYIIHPNHLSWKLPKRIITQAMSYLDNRGIGNSLVTPRYFWNGKFFLYIKQGNYPLLIADVRIILPVLQICPAETFV